MEIQDVINELGRIHNTHGNLPVEGGYMVDDRPLSKITVLDAEGQDAEANDTTPVSVFFE